MKPSDRLRELADGMKTNFSVTTKDHYFIVKFGGAEFASVDLQDAFKQALNFVGESA